MADTSQCFVCDKDLTLSRDRNALLLSNLTAYSHTGLPTKIGQLMGDGFMVVVTACDEACNRCYDLLNLLDKLEVDLDKVRRLLTSYLRKKYGLLESKFLFLCVLKDVFMPEFLFIYRMFVVFQLLRKSPLTPQRIKV